MVTTSPNPGTGNAPAPKPTIWNILSSPIQYVGQAGNGTGLLVEKPGSRVFETEDPVNGQMHTTGLIGDTENSFVYGREIKDSNGVEVLTNPNNYIKDDTTNQQVGYSIYLGNPGAAASIYIAYTYDVSWRKGNTAIEVGYSPTFGKSNSLVDVFVPDGTQVDVKLTPTPAGTGVTVINAEGKVVPPIESVIYPVTVKGVDSGALQATTRMIVVSRKDTYTVDISSEKVVGL